jgi:hypothetical protein
MWFHAIGHCNMDADILFAVLSLAAVGVQLCNNTGLQDAESLSL